MFYVLLLLFLAGAALLIASLLSRAFRGHDPTGRADNPILRFLRGRLVILLGIALVSVGLIITARLYFQLATKSAPGGALIMTLTGTVAIQSGVAVFNPDSGQAVTAPTPMMMQNLPPYGSDQDHMDAAASHFKNTVGTVTVVGYLKPFGSGQILVVQ
ncbi:MAG: hypothetical protein ABR990_11195 [Terracidiphilus sp.]